MNYYLSVYEKKCKSFLILQAFIFPSFCDPGQSYDHYVSRDYINFFTLWNQPYMYILLKILTAVHSIQHFEGSERERERERDFLCSMYLDVKVCTGWPSS